MATALPGTAVATRGSASAGLLQLPAAEAAALPAGVTTFRADPTTLGQVIRDRCGSYSIIRTGVRLSVPGGNGPVLTRVTIRSASGRVVWDHKPGPLTDRPVLGWCGDLLHDGSRVLETITASGDTWADVHFLWLGSSALEILAYSSLLQPFVLTQGQPDALRGGDWSLAGIGTPSGGDIIGVADTYPLPRVYAWRDLRYVDVTRSQKAILRADRAAALKELGTIPSNSTEPYLDARRGILLAVAIESLWIGDWNVVGPALSMTEAEKTSIARLLPVAFEHLGMRVGVDVPADAYLVDPSTVPARATCS